MQNNNHWQLDVFFSPVGLLSLKTVGDILFFSKPFPKLLSEFDARRLFFRCPISISRIKLGRGLVWGTKNSMSDLKAFTQQWRDEYIIYENYTFSCEYFTTELFILAVMQICYSRHTCSFKGLNRFAQAEEPLPGCNWPRAAPGSLSQMNCCLACANVSFLWAFCWKVTPWVNVISI